MKCPKCGVDDDKVLDSRTAREGAAIRRRRECAACGHRFTTYEEVDRDEVQVTDYGFFTPASGNRTFITTKGQQVSIFNFGCRQLSSEGLRWNCYDFDQWWQGTLNEALAGTFSISADGYYLVYQTYEEKHQD